MIPTFLFISAHFSRISKQNKKNKILNQLKTYLIAQIIITLYYSFVLNIIKFNLNIFIPRYTLWFMQVMIYYNLFEYIFNKLNYKIGVLLCFILGLLSGFVSFFGMFLSLQRFFVFLPFYSIGYYSKELNLWENIKKYKYISIILSIIIVIFVLNSKSYFKLDLLKGVGTYYSISGNIFYVCFKRFVFYIFSIIITIGFFNIIPSKLTKITWIGKNTLYIYLSQGAIIKTFVTKKWLVNNSVIGTVLLFLIALNLSILFSIIVKYIKKGKLNNG